jgi:hypothetical protein
MNFSLAHLLKKDLRLTWTYLAAWWGLLVVKAYIVSFGVAGLLDPTFYTYSNAADKNWLERMLSLLPPVLVGLSWLNPLLLAYLVSLVLKADSPIDENALWRTRPVTGRTVLQAKLLYLGLAGLAGPCLVETWLRLHFGFDAGECLRGAVETALLYAAWMGLIASAALLFRKTFTGLLI